MAELTDPGIVEVATVDMTDDDMLAGRQDAVPGLARYTLGKLKAFFLAGVAAFPAFAGNAGKVLAVNKDEDGVEWITPTGGGGSDLPDITGNGGKVLTVKLDESGTEWAAGGAGGGGLYRFGSFFTSEPAANEIVMAHPATDPFTLPADFADSQFKGFGVPINPSADTVFTLKNEGVDVGTITVSNAGAVTFDSTETEIGAGDMLTLHAPADSNGMANWAWTFRSLYTAPPGGPILPAVVVARTITRTDGSDVTLPWTPTEGNLLIVFTFSRNYPSPNTGWTDLGLSDGGNVNRINALARIVQSGDTASIQPNNQSSDVSSMVVFEIDAAYIPGAGIAGLNPPVLGRDSAPHAIPTISLPDKSFVLIGFGSQDSGISNIVIGGSGTVEDSLVPIGVTDNNSSYVHGGGAWFLGQGDFDVTWDAHPTNQDAYAYIVLEGIPE